MTNSKNGPPSDRGFTPQEWEYLKFLRASGRSGPTAGKVYLGMVRTWLWLLVIGATLAAFSAFRDQYYLVYLIAGAIFGVMVRDSARYRHVMSVWPAIAAVTDWKRLEELVDDTLE